MAVGSGLAHQFGYKTESVYGTPVTVDKFLPAKSSALKLMPTFVQGSGMYSGEMLDRGSQRVITTITGEGDVEFDVLNKGLGPWIQCLMGTTVTPVQQAATIAYLQTHTWADPKGKSLTVQTGVPDLAGTVRPYTFEGVKVTEAAFDVTPGELFTAKFSCDAQQALEATALASVSYPTALVPMSGAGVGIRIGTFASEAAVTGVTKASVSIKRLLKTDMYYLGAAGQKAEPIINAKSEAITGTITADFIDKTKFADLFAANTPTSIVLEAVGANIASTYFFTFRITLPACYFNGDTPVVEGPDVVSGDFPFVCLFDGTNLPKIEIIEVATTIG